MTARAQDCPSAPATCTCASNPFCGMTASSRPTFSPTRTFTLMTTSEVRSETATSTSVTALCASVSPPTMTMTNATDVGSATTIGAVPVTQTSTDNGVLIGGIVGGVVALLLLVALVVCVVARNRRKSAAPVEQGDVDMASAQSRAPSSNYGKIVPPNNVYDASFLNHAPQSSNYDDPGALSNSYGIANPMAKAQSNYDDPSVLS
jgi:hypothetical protein